MFPVKLVLAGAAGFILYLALKPKKASAAGFESVKYEPLDPGKRFIPGDWKPVVPTTPTPAATPKRWAYTIRSGDTIIGLAKAWTGKDASNTALQELATENKELQKVHMGTVEYTSDAGETCCKQLVVSPNGPTEVRVTGSMSSGKTYPNNPNTTPGVNGYWHVLGAVYPALSPWNPGQTIKIPESWGAPQSDLPGATPFPGA